jgi:transposase
MPKVCLITRNLTSHNKVWTQVLRHLGIDYTLCVATSGGVGATIQTPQGGLAANSADLRNYFRQFDAVILCDHALTLSETAVINYSVYWLSWNAPEDPPFLFFNPHFSTAITESAYNSNFPSDFPIVRPNASDLAGTLYAADGGSPSAGNPLFAGGVEARGACVLFLAENIRAHVMTVCNAHGASGSSNVVPYYWRLNPTQHSTLANTNYTHRAARNGRAGEILAVPAPPTNPEDTETYPSDCVVAYRYRNIFWLPHAIRRFPDTINLHSSYRLDALAPMLFWLLYGLQLAGVRPRYKLPVQMETDHPIESFPSTPPFNFSYRQQMEALLAKHDYMREFARRTGTAIIHGVRVGGRHRTTSGSFHWQMMYNTNIPADARAVAQQINQLLVAGHREGTTPCGVHDHTAGNFQGGYWLGDVRAGFRRHSGMRYGAPNNVPISRGRCCVAPHVLPSGVAPPNALTVQVGDAEMVEWDHTMSGTGDTFDLPLGNIHAARVIIESEIEEMLALGFPDGHCAGHKYTNTAANASGGECYWQALKEFGFRGVRSASACNAPLNTKRVAPNRLWHGFHLITDVWFDLASPSAAYARGLYHPDSPTNGDGVRLWQLDHGNDISTNWTTSAVAAWRAYRRVVCQGIGTWLFATAVVLGGFYIHPITQAMIVSLSDPLARFDGWSKQNVIGEPHYCHPVELLENMDAVVRLLSDVLYWGTITDVMDLRERVLG